MFGTTSSSAVLLILVGCHGVGHLICARVAEVTATLQLRSFQLASRLLKSSGGRCSRCAQANAIRSDA